MVVKRADQISPLVSIVIPVYNGSNYMREAIDSALAQTYSNIEVIVVNDGSKDDGKTDAIAKEYGDRIRYFVKENGGCASALNLGIKNIKGVYFSWLSHDDVYYPNKIEHQINVINKLQNPDTIIYGGYEVINSNSKSLYYVRPDNVATEDKLNIPLFPLLRGLIHGCSMIIPVKYFKEIGIFDESLPSTQDYDLWFKFLRVAPIHFDNAITIKSRVHEEQGTHKIVNHLNECNELWSGFLKELTEVEMTAMEGSPYLFLIRTAAFLANTPYTKARDLATQMAKQTLDNIKISVVMPVYNRINWTIEAIHSVLTQTHQNFELIVVDDGSTDDIALLLEVCNKDSRILYVRTENNGAAAARNLGVRKASGKYVVFLDSDDLFYQNKLEVQLKYMENNGWLFSHTSYERVNVKREHISFISSGTICSGYVFPQIISSCQIATPTVMGTTSLLRANPFPENISIGEDCCTWIAIASENYVGGISAVLSKVRVSDVSAYTDHNKYALGLINISAFVMNNKNFSKFSPLLTTLLYAAIDNIKSLDTKTEQNAYRNNLFTRINILPSPIRLLIGSLKRNGFRSTMYKIYWRLKR